jgi:hypothetical protein
MVAVAGCLGSGPPPQLFSAECAPDAVHVFWPFNGDAYTPNIFAVPTGGRAPYTYQWLHVSGDVIGITPSATAQVVQFYLYGDVPLHSVNQCTITDADGLTAVGQVTIDGN